MQKHEYQGPFARKYFAEGREEGRIAGRAEAARARVLACRDLATLDRWLVRAADASSIEDVLDS